jgi:hypothetical protein
MKIQSFYLNRKEDETGVSGTGVVAIGAILPSGHCVMEWLTFTSSIAIYKSLNDVSEIHGHGGKTEVMMGDPPVKKTTKKKKASNG